MDKVVVISGIVVLFVLYLAYKIRAQRRKYEAYKSNLDAMKKIQGRLSAQLSNKENSDDDSK